jgi:hypothetical protein
MCCTRACAQAGLIITLITVIFILTVPTYEHIASVNKVALRLLKRPRRMLT